MSERNGTAVSWLLQSGEPAIRLMTRRDVLGQQDPGDPDEVLAGPMLMALLSGQQPDGGFGVHFYRKWTGAHWRLISLTELEIPPLEPRAVAAASTVLARLDPARTRVAVIDGLARRCASIEGNALAVWCRRTRCGPSRARRRRRPDRLAVARRRMELRQGRQWPALVVSRIHRPGLGTA